MQEEPKRLRFSDISMRQPCHESWQAMDPTQGGRYCFHCHKEVIDFTSMSEQELNATLAATRPGERRCGRFLKTQIAPPKPHSKPAVKANTWLRGAAAALAMLGTWHLHWAKAASPTLSVLPAGMHTILTDSPEDPHPPRRISVVILDQDSLNIRDDIVVTLVLPDGKSKRIVTRAGFFSYALDSDYAETGKVRITVGKQSFETTQRKAEYKPLQVSTTIANSQNWTVLIHADVDDYGVWMGDFDF